jgi:glycosyltransferase involved in cell wall biosynthesis
MLYGGMAAASIARPAIGTLSAFACMDGDRDYAFLPQNLHTRSLRNRLRNRVAGGLMSRVAVVSTRAGESFVEANAMSRRKLRVIGYGVDIDGVERVSAEEVARVRTEVGASPGEVLVGSVGRLVEQKDYPTQLRALALVARRWPVRMIVAGAGPLASQLRGLAERLGIADRVCWLGERRDVPAVLRCLDAFVIASKFEPFGVSVLEAMAAGLPIVSTDVNELPEILDGGRAGMLVPAERPEELAHALDRISADPALRARLGTHARSIARERYSLPAAVTAYTNLYDEVMKETVR